MHKDLIRLLSKIAPETAGVGCEYWQGTFFTGKRYGQFHRRVNKRDETWLATRASWELRVGPIPDGMMVCHRCNNPPCVNPAHLYLGNQSSNMADRDRCGRTSAGAHRYNFKRDADLAEAVARLRGQGSTIEDICTSLGIGRTTYYRIKAAGLIQQEVDDAVKRGNYRKAAFRRG